MSSTCWAMLGKDLADPGAALAVLGELERRLHHRADLLREEAGVLVEALQLLAVALLQLRLVVPGIDLARPAVHEQPDDALRLGGKMALLRRRADSAAGRPPSRCVVSAAQAGGEQPFVGQQCGQGEQSRRRRRRRRGVRGEIAIAEVKGDSSWVSSIHRSRRSYPLASAHPKARDYDGHSIGRRRCANDFRLSCSTARSRRGAPEQCDNACHTISTRSNHSRWSAAGRNRSKR